MRFFYFSIIYLSSCIILLSCGYTKAEDDKFPDMPVFPEHTNEGLEIASLGMRLETLYNYREDNVIASARYMIKNIGGEKMYVVRMNKDLKVLDSIRTYGIFKVIEDGSFFINDDRGRIYKYSSFRSKPLLVENHPFNFADYKKEVSQQLYNGKYAKGQYSDSLSRKIYEIVDSLSSRSAFDEFKNRQIKGLECLIDLYPESNSILIYDDIAYISNKYPYSDDSEALNDLLHTSQQCPGSAAFLVENNNGLSLFDKAVRSNGSSGGNHFIPGLYYPQGLQYYSLRIGKNETFFKIFADRIYEQQISVRYLPISNVYLINVLERRENWSYAEKPTYIIRTEN